MAIQESIVFGNANKLPSKQSLQTIREREVSPSFPGRLYDIRRALIAEHMYAIKTLKTIATLNRKDLKTNMKKNADMKARSKFNRIKTKKLSKVFDNIGNSEINQSMVEEIAMETEQKALATLHYYLLDTNINEQDCDAYRSSKFLCLSQEGNSIEHTCCYFY